MTMTLQQIADKLPELPIVETYNKTQYMTLNQAERTLEGDELEAYSYLWRNMTYTFSNILIGYQLDQEN